MLHYDKFCEFRSNAQPKYLENYYTFAGSILDSLEFLLFRDDAESMKTVSKRNFVHQCENTVRTCESVTDELASGDFFFNFSIRC